MFGDRQIHAPPATNAKTARVLNLVRMFVVLGQNNARELPDIKFALKTQWAVLLGDRFQTVPPATRAKMAVVSGHVPTYALLAQSNARERTLIKLVSKEVRVVLPGVLPQTVPPATRVRMAAVSGHAPMSVLPDPNNVRERTHIKLASREVRVAMSGVLSQTVQPATRVRMVAASDHAPMSVPPDPNNAREQVLIKPVLKVPVAVLPGARPIPVPPATLAKMAAVLGHVRINALPGPDNVRGPMATRFVLKHRTVAINGVMQLIVRLIIYAKMVPVSDPAPMSVRPDPNNAREPMVTKPVLKQAPVATFGVQLIIATMVTPARMEAVCLPAPTSVRTGKKNAPVIRATVSVATMIATSALNGVRPKTVLLVMYAKAAIVSDLVPTNVCRARNNAPVIPHIRLVKKTRQVVMFGVQPLTVLPAMLAKMDCVSSHAPMSVRPDPNNAQELTATKLA